MRISAVALLALLLTTSCSNSFLQFDSPVPQSAPLQTTPYLIDAYSLPALPSWTVAFQDPGDMRFLDMDKLMKDFGLSRYQASEVQNGYRDSTRPFGLNPIAQTEKEKIFNEVLKKVQQDGSFEKSLDEAKIAKADFVVIFDLDNTLYDQYTKTEGPCAEVQFESKISNKKMRIKLAPGWEEIIQTIHRLGGTSVLFTAWLDHLTRENLEHWDFEGKPLLESDKIAGFLGNSHLTMGRKEGSEGPRERRTKDIRIVDPSLKKAILVDNNPTLTFQFQNLRVVLPFHGDNICAPVDPSQTDLFKQSLLTVMAEIEESIQYQKANPGTSFQQAYLPYSELGRLTKDSLLAVPGTTESAAIEKIRKIPTIVPKSY